MIHKPYTVSISIHEIWSISGHFSCSSLCRAQGPNVAVSSKELLLQDRGLTSLDSLEPFKNLKKLELKGNFIASLSSFHLSAAKKTDQTMYVELCYMVEGELSLTMLDHQNHQRICKSHKPMTTHWA